MPIAKRAMMMMMMMGSHVCVFNAYITTGYDTIDA